MERAYEVENFSHHGVPPQKLLKAGPTTAEAITTKTSTELMANMPGGVISPELNAGSSGMFMPGNRRLTPVGPNLTGRYPTTLLVFDIVDHFYTAGHLICKLIDNITTSGKTDLESDVEQLLKLLVPFSFAAGSELQADYWPTFCDILFGTLRDGLQYINDKVTNVSEDEVIFDKQLRNLRTTCLAIRNMAMEANNAQRFASIDYLKDILVDGLNLPIHHCLGEVRSYIFDMAESMAPFLAFHSNDPFLRVLTQAIKPLDRGTILSAMWAMCRFTLHHDDCNRMAEIPVLLVRRIAGGLIHWDDGLAEVCLNFLCQYTLHRENIRALLATPEGSALIGHLVRIFLPEGLRGDLSAANKLVKTDEPSPSNVPHLPDEIVRELLAFDEPKRTRQWYVIYTLFFCPD